MWLNGIAFASNVDGTVYVSDTSSSPINRMFDTLERIMGDEPDLLPVAYGASNSFYQLGACHIEWVRFFCEQIMVPIDFGRVGLRTGNFKTDLEWKEPDFGWQEAWMVLHAAARGVHPRVYGCVLFKRPDDRRSAACYVMESGIDLHTFLIKYPHRAETSVLPLGYLLEWALKRASDMGLLLSDNKTDNMVVILDGTDQPKLIKFIDFGADFARLDDADPECIYFINAFLLVNQAKCSLRGYATASMTSNILERLGELITKYEETTQTNLCHILVYMKADEARRWSSLFGEKDPTDIAKGVVHQARHYNVDCGEQGQFDKGRPLVPQMLAEARRLLNVAPRAHPRPWGGPSPPSLLEGYILDA